MYTIGKVAEMFGIPVSTLRYYDKEGLFPNMERTSGIRQFGDEEIEMLRLIECLKSSGLEIREIRQFIEWCAQGSTTYALRRQMFEDRKAAVEAEIERLERTRAVLKYKCWCYDKAIEEGTDDALANIRLEDMPEDIRKTYEFLHRK